MITLQLVLHGKIQYYEQTLFAQPPFGRNQNDCNFAMYVFKFLFFTMMIFPKRSYLIWHKFIQASSGDEEFIIQNQKDVVLAKESWEKHYRTEYNKRDESRQKQIDDLQKQLTTYQSTAVDHSNLCIRLNQVLKSDPDIIHIVNNGDPNITKE